MHIKDISQNSDIINNIGSDILFPCAYVQVFLCGILEEKLLDYRQAIYVLLFFNRHANDPPKYLFCFILPAMLRIFTF